MVKFSKFQFATKSNEISDQHAQIVVGPLTNGFGITIGNALRRTMLSAVPGTAVFAVKINSITHEFQPISGVKEDVMQLILNIKKVIVKVDENVLNKEDFDEIKIENWPTLKISAKEPGVINAGDIECPTGFTIVNKNLYIGTLVEAGKKLDVDIYVTIGYGFRSAKVNAESLSSLSLIPVDSSFSPIVKFSYSVDERKSGKNEVVDYLTLDISTDGSIKPINSFAIAAKILIDHFTPFVSLDEKVKEMQLIETEKAKTKKKQLATSIDELNLSYNSLTSLKKIGILTVQDLIQLTREELSKNKEARPKYVKEIVARLNEIGLSLKGE